MARIALHAVGFDRHRRAPRQPGVAVQAGTFVPPALHRIGIDADGHDVQRIPEPRERRDVEVEAVIARPIVRDRTAVHPDGCIGRDAVELQFQVTSLVGGIEAEGTAIPADPARAVALRRIGGLDERLEACPVVRQRDGAPLAVVIVHRRRAARVARLGAQIRLFVRRRGRYDHVALMEQPARVEADPRRIDHRQRIGQPGGGQRHRQRAIARRAPGGGDGGQPRRQTQCQAGSGGCPEKLPPVDRHAFTASCSFAAAPGTATPPITVSTGAIAAVSRAQSARNPAASVPRSASRPKKAAGLPAAIRAATAGSSPSMPIALATAVAMSRCHPRRGSGALAARSPYAPRRPRTWRR
ncbi:hypothetical protein WR25_26857 [Diploscapter pachys]|uniref:Uncharacterized protein n=1 Tax=Diploscapter pachys TaxID=2018661 RepID=A0A2A2M371_9BILA|nr:hypothetical protein WR25_26857 [Diploscapter pachys]